MSETRHERLTRLFQEALEVPEEERLRFVDRECRDDDDLRSELLRMILSDRDAGDFLAMPLEGTAQAPPTAPSHRTLNLGHIESADPQPHRIGTYRIFEEIGRGGMGIVYRARQENPERDVALKVLPSIFASKRTLQRFQTEADVLGRFHHPGIARILEAGIAETERGPQPFLALELVEGVRPTELVREGRLSLRERARLVIRISEAVQYAHEKAVLHRDLKPSNILVSPDGQPKILDFGVARLLDDQLEDATDATRPGELVGTLPYMSPEQCGGDHRLVDVRTDVWALGVLGFQLITGRLPIEVESGTQAELLASVRSASVQRLRAVQPTAPLDLEMIFAKALEREPEDRYPTVQAWIDDLKAFVEHRPVSARPIRWPVRWSRWARRQPLAAGLIGSLLAMLLVAGFLGARLQSQLAESERLRAQADYDRLVDLGQTLFESIQVQDYAAFESEIGEHLVPSTGETFEAKSQKGAYVDGTAARTYFRRALDLDPSRDDALVGLLMTHWWQGRHAEALALLDRHGPGRLLTFRHHLLQATGRATALEKPPPPQEPDEMMLEALRVAGRRSHSTGPVALEEAAAMIERAIRLSPRPRRWFFTSLAAIRYRISRVGGNEPILLRLNRLRLSEVAEDLEKLWPDSPLHLFWRALAAEQRRDLSSAIDLLTEYLAERGDSGSAWCRLGGLRERQGDLEEALSCYDRAIELEPQLAVFHFQRGNVLHKLGRTEAALEAFEGATDFDPELSAAWTNAAWDQLRAGRPALAREFALRATLLTPNDWVAHYNLGKANEELDRLQRAARAYERSAELNENLRPRANLAMVLTSLGDYAGAESWFAEALERVPPEDRRSRHVIDSARVMLEMRRGRFDEALEILESIGESYSTPRNTWRRGTLLHRVGRLEEAKAHFESIRGSQEGESSAGYWIAYGDWLHEIGEIDASIGAFQTAIEREPRDPEAHRGLYQALQSKGDTEALARALEMWESVETSSPSDLQILAEVVLEKAAESKRIPDASKALDIALRAAEACERDDPSVLYTLAKAQRLGTRSEEALETAREALGLIEQGAYANPSLAGELRLLLSR